MPINNDKPARWRDDITQSVDLYNGWFLNFAPEAFRSNRLDTTGQVEAAFAHTANLTALTPETLSRHPEVLPILRMATCPPLARDRLVGLSGAPKQLVKSMELDARIPPRMSTTARNAGLEALCRTISAMLDPDIVVWAGRGAPPNPGGVHRAASIVADRLCGALTDPIIRNAQEQRQLALISEWLQNRTYRQLDPADVHDLRAMRAGTFAFRLNVPVTLAEGRGRRVNIPVDVAVKPVAAPEGSLPVMIEAKSAGDFTNVNKRRKEEATKVAQLRANYGPEVTYILFLCGYFDSGYLSYEAAEGIDWVWEHRIDDFAELL